ncbi:sulfite exporter TauE/SafE family protein [Magnetococcales bacterium HHB-1]
MLSLLIGAFIAGLVAGIIAGLFGVGGGVIIVPTLLLLFHIDGINPTFSMQLAVGTSLATITVTNISATFNHHQRKSVSWELAWQYTPGILLGALFGVQLAVILSGETLRLLFGLFEILVGLKMAGWLPTPQLSKPLLQGREHLNPFVGICIGTISSLFGIGGGTLTVPTLNLLANVPIRLAIGTSSAIGIAIAISGTIGYIYTGWYYPELPANALGFFMPHMFFGVIAGTLLCTPLGVQLAHSLDPDRLKRWFGLFLILIGIKIIFSH